MRKVVVKVLRVIALLAGLALLLTWLARAVLPPTSSRSVTYSELATAIEKDQVEAVEIHEDRILARLRVQPGERAQTIVAERIPAVEDPTLLEAMRAHHVEVAGKIEKSTTWSIFLWLVLPILALPILLLVSRGMDTRGRPMSFGRSKAKLYDTSSEQRATFADVAGVDESRAELEEVVRFLKEPERYRAVGARVPKGVLLVGPPGTGKTLLARAVAGESGVPFFSLSGSEFVEMFVGVGASRVRDLFEQAKARAPCIVFIDELDAVGKTRAGPSGFAANEEREQTLNQLLVEMDGFDPGSGLVIMAATNRPEILDRALLRAGRFDRQVLVDRPDVRGREAILRVHAKKVKLAPDVDLGVVAHRTPGMVGADLANVVNEAALASVRRNADVVAGKDFEEAIDRIQLGLRKEGRVMSEHEKRRVSFHEAGHALAALTVEHADPVHRVTIIPRSIGALGATLQLPTDDRYLVTREELRDQLCVLLAGRAAEEVACTDVSTGAQNDLERATETARQMVCRFGMSEKLGPLTYGRSSAARFLAPAVDFGDERNFSESTAELIDAEVRALVDAEHDRARRILAERNVALHAIANELLTKETLERADLDAILARVSSKVRGAAAQ